MALILKDRISETTTTTGTGTLTLDGALSGFQPFSSIGDTNTTYYCITDGAAWEVGLGTYSTSGDTLARTTVLSNSNGNTSPITLSAGTKTVFSVYPAERAIVVDGTTIQIPNNAVLPIANGGTGSNTATFSGANITDLNATAITAGTISNARTTASSSNGASSIVQRDASGDFSANIITANSYTGSGASLTSLNASSISSGTLSAANGGTGQTSLTANNVILGNGTSAVQFVAPGTSSNVLTSNGSTWISSAAAGGGGFTRGTTTSLSGNSVDLPVTSSTANMIVVAIANLSGNGTSIPIIRVAADGFLIATATLYASVQLAIPSGATPGGTANTSGWAMNNSSAAANGLSGTFVLSKLSNYVYTAQAIWGVTAGAQVNLRCQLSSGYIDINNVLVGGAPIDRVRLTFVNGTDSFDGGSASIFWQ